MVGNIPITFDTTELEAATRILAAHLKKDVPKAINKKMGWLLRRWLWYTPKADIGKIASSLNIRMRLGKSGEKTVKIKGVSRTIKFKGGWKMAHGRTFGEAPLAALIIQARRRKSGAGSPFKGVSRSKGASAMRKLVAKMTKARARSSGFLKSGIAAALKPFLPFASSHGPGVPPIDRDKNLKPTGSGITGIGQTATDTVPMAIAIDRTLTKKSSKGVLSNKGMMKYARPALERAYKEETADTVAFLNKQLYETARALGISAKL